MGHQQRTSNTVSDKQERTEISIAREAKKYKSRDGERTAGEAGSDEAGELATFHHCIGMNNQTDDELKRCGKEVSRDRTKQDTKCRRAAHKQDTT